MPTHPLLQLLVETVRNDDELDLQLRGLYVDIYYQGYNAFQIHFPGRKVRLGSEHDKDRPEYWPKKWMLIDDISTEHVPQALQWVKIQRDKQLAPDERNSNRLWFGTTELPTQWPWSLTARS